MTRVLMGVVKAYRLLLSPWLGSSCRFEPTCSVYALQALERFGAAKGGYVHGGLMFGANPPGPDDGAVNLDLGEYVIKKSSVDKYGRGLLDMINEGKVPAKKMKSLLG